MSGMLARTTSLIRAKVAKGHQDENGPVGTIPEGWREVAGDQISLKNSKKVPLRVSLKQ